jgi:hypothetical protein
MRQVRLIRPIIANRWRPVLAGAEINFIRPLAPLQKFELVTRIVTWDKKYFYLEQRFESRGILCAHAFVKGLFVGPRGSVGNGDVMAAAGLDMEPPMLPEELRVWAELDSIKKQKA